MLNPITNSELLARLIFCPRFCDNELKRFNNRFIFLRENEEGISCCRFSLMTKAQIDNRGKLLANKNVYKGYALAVVNEIIAIDETVIYITATSNDHAEIRFKINGETMHGNVRSSQLQYYFDEIKELFLKNIVTV